MSNEVARNEVESKTRKWKRKRGSHSKNVGNEGEWTDEDTLKLIDLWANHECLYNTKTSAYLNKDKESHAFDCSNISRHGEVTNKKSGAVENPLISKLLWRGKQQSRKVQNKWL